MDLGLKGKKVILTGGSRGIGRASLEYFAQDGCDVAFFSRSDDKVKAAAKELSTHGGKVFGESFEVTSDTDAYGAWLEKAAGKLGGCDVFVHNISASGAGATADWDKVFELDIKPAVKGVEVLTPYLEKSDAAAIILMVTTAAVEKFFVPQAYNALKASLLTYGSQLAQALGPQGIRVNMVSPGPIEFPGGNWENIKTGNPDFYAATEANMALGRFGNAEDVARTVVFLASPASSYTTGTNVVVDGGYTKRVQF